MHNNEFKTYQKAEEYYKKNVETGDDISHMCTSGCGNDFDCPILPYEEWLESEEVVIAEAEEITKSDDYDEKTAHKA